MTEYYDTPEAAEDASGRTRHQELNLAREAGIFKNTALYKHMIETIRSDCKDAIEELKGVRPNDAGKIMKLQVKIQSCEMAETYIDALLEIGEMIELEHEVEQGEIP